MGKKKQYILGMFPYPSGDGLHVGHVRIYTAVDVMARYLRMKGYEVMCPTGWDAFGLPAENAAIKAKTNPKKIVPRNYHNFRKQMQNLSFAFDWEREFATTDPSYYGLTQWIFLELYKKGLVYREKVPINWCPKCKTGLANEEVLPDGTHERCGELTGKKELPQWVMKITEYADRLLEDLRSGFVNLGELDWPRGILEMQRNWIGKKEGARVKFKVQSSKCKVEEFEVFTTRVDTINGVTFVVVAPEVVEEWIKKGWETNDEVKKYVKQAIGKTEQKRLAEEKEKTGVDTRIRAINPWNQESVPIYVADYVLSDYGTGWVMGVPQYDERDRVFATKYGIEIKDIPLDDYEEVLAKLEKLGLAKKQVSYHLRDWVFSRQRYWGEPIPLVHCPECGVVPMSEKELPLELPDLESYEPTDTGESPLSRVEEWVSCKCPKCGGEARRETDTMPNWAGSCWYHLAFSFWKNEKSGGKEDSTKAVLEQYRQGSKTPFSDFWKEYAKPRIEKWLPVDWYLGGAEHAVLHLLYARFWNKALYDLGHLSFPEPYLRLRSVGMVLAEDGRKMSKSWGNVINPDDVVKEYGSDAVRLYEMFMGPWNQVVSWDSRALVGMRRFLERVEATFQDKKRWGEKTSLVLAAELSGLAKQVERGVLTQKFNTCIAGMMELTNRWRNENLVMSRGDGQKLAAVISPFAPQTAERLWQATGGKGKVEESEWPSLESFDDALDNAPVTIAVQVNGKLRSTIQVNQKTAQDKEELLKVVLVDERVKMWLSQGVKKTILVPGRLINLVV